MYVVVSMRLIKKIMCKLGFHKYVDGSSELLDETQTGVWLFKVDSYCKNCGKHYTRLVKVFSKEYKK